ncbi:DUF58 domain-containing protein [Nakamurella flava]|uniref:DUF58 domain-containing protein n=1 Tax=Nakamurella flava TaxID=2576308 RepID=A0A4U6Q7R7_9ACTN|nr:DUF58 domain-containing protein [Nakamurella flava]TKV56098.1 DUF58 domain-containing protein [Nakamurella flava]
MADPAGSDPRAVARGLTTRGRCLLAGGVAAGACAFVLDERDLLRAGVFAVGLALLAVVVGLTRRVRLAADHRVTPARLEPGTQGLVRITVTNTGTGRTSPLELTEPATDGLTAGLCCLLPPLRRGRSAQTDFPLRAERRGRFELGPPLVRIGDPFGLWQEHRVLPARTQVLVVPSVVPLAGMPSSRGTRSAASDRARSGSVGGDPDVGVRPYQHGDDIRTVHWRASARTEDLMVRLAEPVSHGGATVVLDHRAAGVRGPGAASSLETAVSLVASVCLHLLQAEHQIRLTTHSGHDLASGRDITDDVLAALAVVEPDPAGILHPSALARTGLTIAVLGGLDSASAHLLVAGRTPGTNAVALLLDVSDWDGTDRAVQAAQRAAAEILRSGGWRVVRVRRGEPLAAAWERACSGRPALWSTGPGDPGAVGEPSRPPHAGPTVATTSVGVRR